VSGGDRQRIDRWLWNARVVRTRTAAAALVVAGHVRVNGNRVAAPGRDVKCGDVVTVALHGGVRVLKVTGVALRRGDAAAAALIYVDLSGGTGNAPAPQAPATLDSANQRPAAQDPATEDPATRIPPSSRRDRKHDAEND
jgi:ribosome-associated heat shock protein Hsp15